MFALPDQSSLLVLGAEADRRPEWRTYARYLILRGQGVRSRAMRAMDGFLDEARPWSLAEQRALIDWLVVRTRPFLFDNMVVPQSMLRYFVVPALDAWLASEPACAEAFYLRAMACTGRPGEDALALLRAAVQCDPGHQEARRDFAHRIIACVGYNQHELPDYGYLGTAGEDVTDLKEALDMVDRLGDPSGRQAYRQELTNLLAIAEAWQAYATTDRQAGFLAWCEANGGPVRLVDPALRNEDELAAERDWH